MKKNIIVFILLLLFSFYDSWSQVKYRIDWPKVSEFKKIISIDALSTNIHYIIPIKDQLGKTIYTLTCRGGSTEFLDKLSDSTGLNYVGPLCFFLFTGPGSEENAPLGDDFLLCEDGSAPWYSRGQITDYRELIGDCGRYPEYGSLRHFRVRGFELTLHFVNIAVEKDSSVSRFDVAISIHCDSTITSSLTEQTGYLTPYKLGRSCKKILRGDEPRMFRNKDGDWIDEKELLKQKNH